MEAILNNLSNENEDIYICGDFYKTFYEQMCSYDLLPQIIQPTRIIDTTATIVDNIFTNNMNNNILSCNIITDFSDH